MKRRNAKMLRAVGMGTVLLASIHLGGPGAARADTIATWGCAPCDSIPPAGDDFVAISQGQSHGLALREDGTIAGWGCNGSGQIDVPGDNDFVAVSAGELHSLALRSNGSPVAWGDNSFGQGTVPQGIGSVVAIDASGNYNVVLQSDGSLFAWGRNNYGQTSVLPGNDFVAIAAGRGGHAHALRSDGSITGWGRGDYGQQSGIPAGNDFVAIATGDDHSLALKSDHTVVCWGRTDYCPGFGCMGGNDFAAIACGYNHNLALRLDGSVLAWGCNNCGQVDAPAGTGFTAVAGGAGWSGALRVATRLTLARVDISTCGRARVDIQLSNWCAVQALSFGVAHDSGILMASSFEAALAWAGGPPDFLAVNLEASGDPGLCSGRTGVTVAMVGSTLDPDAATIPPGTSNLLGTLSYDPARALEPGDASALELVECLVPAPGSPPVECKVICDGVAVPAKKVSGAVVITERCFRRGHCNSDPGMNIGDPVFLLLYLFSGGLPPSCLDACNANDDAGLDISDALHMLAFLFLGGPGPPPPFPGCGSDPTTDDLGCEAFAGCEVGA